jgi:hypothetical protein
MERLIKTRLTKQRPISNNSTVTDRHNCGGAVTRSSLHCPSWRTSSLQAGKTQRVLLPWIWRRYVNLKPLFLLKPRGIISQKTTSVIVTTVKTSQKTVFFGPAQKRKLLVQNVTWKRNILFCHGMLVFDLDEVYHCGQTTGSQSGFCNRQRNSLKKKYDKLSLMQISCRRDHLGEVHTSVV